MSMTDMPAASKLPALLTVAAALLALSFLVIEGSDFAMLLGARSSFKQALAAQQSPIDEGQKLRQQLDNLVKGIDALAQSGNANARGAMDYLHSQGVNLRKPAAKADQAPAKAQ